MRKLIFGAVLMGLFWLGFAAGGLFPAKAQLNCDRWVNCTNDCIRGIGCPQRNCDCAEGTPYENEGCWAGFYVCNRGVDIKGRGVGNCCPIGTSGGNRGRAASGQCTASDRLKCPPGYEPNGAFVENCVRAGYCCGEGRYLGRQCGWYKDEIPKYECLYARGCRPVVFAAPPLLRRTISFSPRASSS